MQEKLSGRMGLEVKMNAYELADDMENGMFNDANYNRKKAADFVRKQADEIKNLQEQFDKAIEFLTKANNMTRKQ